MRAGRELGVARRAGCWGSCEYASGIPVGGQELHRCAAPDGPERFGKPQVPPFGPISPSLPASHCPPAQPFATYR